MCGTDPSDPTDQRMSQQINSTMDVVRIAARTIRHHPPIWPLAFITATGLSMAGMAITRWALFHPEVAFDRKKDTRPWEGVKPGTVLKFFDVINRKSGIYRDEGDRRPDYRQ